MSIPAECSELEHVTPPSLKNLAVPPVFILRPASGREWRKYQYVMRAEGLEYHNQDAFRDETLRALRALWSEETYQANEDRLRNYWALVEQGGKPDEAETEAVAKLSESLSREWERLRVMAADNMQFVDESLKIALSMFLVGWTGVPLSYSREGGRVPLEKLDELEDWLEKQEKAALEANIEGVLQPGTAFLELCNAAYKRLHLDKDEEKNSSSPPPAPSARNGSKTKRSPKTAAARSKASASSASGATAG
jgi:hypothetical protein